MADEFERAQDLEEAERTISLQQHASRPRSQPREDCVDCGDDLAPHRHEFGTCIECQTSREQRARLYRKD